MKIQLILKKTSVIGNFILVIKITICTILAFIVSLYLIFLYKNYSYSEKQRDLWNSAMTEQPSDSIEMHIISSHHDDTMKKSAEREKLRNKEAPDFNILWPEEIDLNKLPFCAMTEAELLSLPKERKSYAYYQELMSRFMLDSEKLAELIADMKSIHLPHADFFGELCLLSRRTINKYTDITDFNCKKIPGYENFKNTVLFGNYEAYSLFLFLNKNNDMIMERALLKILETNANKGDSKSQRELANLLFLQEKRNFSSFNLMREWRKISETESPPTFSIPFFAKNNAIKVIEKIKVVQKISIIQEYYKKSAESGDLESMYLWINQKLDALPNLCSRSDWNRIKQYYNILVKRGDWRIYKDLTSLENNYFNNFLRDYYSKESIDKLIDSIEKSSRKNGSLIYLSKLTGEDNSLHHVNGIITPDMEEFILDKLSNLQKISNFQCYFSAMYLYEENITTKRITSTLLKSIEISARNKNPHALYLMACIYEKGIWKTKDLKKSSDLLYQALALCNSCKDYSIYVDNTNLQLDTNLVDYESEYVPLNYAIPRKFIEINLNKNFADRTPQLAYETAQKFLDHYFVNKNIFIQFVPSFEYYLGKMYESGEGVEQDSFKAERWYKKGVEKGNPHCALMLGNLYENGGELIKNKELSIFYYKLASENLKSANDEKLKIHINKRLGK